MKKFLTTFCALFILAQSAWANPLPTVAVPPTRHDGDTITAAIWNNDIGNIYSYINAYLIPALNVLNTAGDGYFYSGSALGRFSVGTANQVVIADSSQPLGVRWGTVVNTVILTTRGDLVTSNGATAQRLPVGTNGYVLIADSSQTLGLRWASSPSLIPSGTIVAWSPAVAGSNSIPGGWVLCNGSNSTPNMIGMIPIGGRPAGSSSAANPAGYGLEAVDSLGHGSPTHTHTIPSTTGTTGAANGTYSASSGSTAVASGSHTHSFTYGGISTSSASTEPADYSLVYIMKQ